jgi:hypothetical protein
MSFINKFSRTINIRSYSIFKKHKPVKLGRWGLDYTNTGIKSDYATHDSCGGQLCGNPPASKKIVTKEKYDISEDDVMLYSLIGSYHLDPKK